MRVTVHSNLALILRLLDGTIRFIFVQTASELATGNIWVEIFEPLSQILRIDLTEIQLAEARRIGHKTALGDR